MPRRPSLNKPSRKRVPEELAKDAIAHEEAVGSDKVRMTFRVILGRQQAEALAARAIKEEKKNIGALVTEILEAAVKRKAGPFLLPGEVTDGRLCSRADAPPGQDDCDASICVGRPDRLWAAVVLARVRSLRQALD